MLLSQRCEYAVRAALYLAAADRTGYVAVREISEALGIPRSFLAKTVQDLTAAGVFTSMRGPSGGLALARPAHRTTIEEVVLAVDGSALFTECVLGLPGCDDLRPCPLHAQWRPMRARVRAMFAGATLGDTAVQVRDGKFRLALEAG
ncbi:RrF2 family transcriptional regulator [Rubrivirga litoralis]|uniref:Rrf2 family transcriptional regulator n=1 Tax=Rubrivirga litoralis TaxID=3075598 RepID=A0ABU3BR65_9BACT|nr:Rrf2 family transcriptional regulator [Rubrivirga sp. F394]MDT0631786.1 Rrf2 family transcriptional regulator [Rubrivirga sp. F394]